MLGISPMTSVANITALGGHPPDHTQLALPMKKNFRNFCRLQATLSQSKKPRRRPVIMGRCPTPPTWSRKKYRIGA